jgi:hypothetical protein
VLSFINVQKILHVTSFFWMADGPFVEYLGLFDTPVSYNTVGNIDFAAAVLASLKEINPLKATAIVNICGTYTRWPCYPATAFFSMGLTTAVAALSFKHFARAPPTSAAIQGRSEFGAVPVAIGRSRQHSSRLTWGLVLRYIESI